MSPGSFSVQLEAFGKPNRVVDGSCAYSAGSDTVKSIGKRSVAIDVANVDTFSAPIALPVDSFSASLRYKVVWGGSRGSSTATWANGERLSVQYLEPPANVLEFRDQLIMQPGSTLQIVVRNAASFTPSATLIKARRATVQGTLSVILESFTPTAAQLATQSFTIAVPNVFAVERFAESSFAFSMFVSTTVSGFKPSTAIVTASGQLELTFVSGTPPTTTPSPPVTSPVGTTASVATTTTTTLADTSGGTNAASSTNAPDGLSLFGLSGIVLYATLGGAGLGVLLILVCIIVTIVLCRRKSDRNAHAYDSGAMIHMHSQPSRHDSQSNFSAPPTLKPPPTLGTQDYVTTPSALPPILALDARQNAYSQPKTVVGSSDIAF